MFTGIVEELGAVAAIVSLDDSVRLSIRGPLVSGDAAHGDSIAVNGVCLTVVEVDDGVFTADVMRETLDCSSLGALAVGDPVNLERAATLGTRLGGHLVQGHVDGVGHLLAREPGERWETANGAGHGRDASSEPACSVRFAIPGGLDRYIVHKGSITVDGVSLTVASAEPGRFSVGLIPTTLKLTTLGTKGVGDPVNLEVDVIAKYVEKLLGARA